jgi:hypothetical protein
MQVLSGVSMIAWNQPNAGEMGLNGLMDIS